MRTINEYHFVSVREQLSGQRALRGTLDERRALSVEEPAVSDLADGLTSIDREDNVVRRQMRKQDSGLSRSCLDRVTDAAQPVGMADNCLQDVLAYSSRAVPIAREPGDFLNQI